MYNEEVKMQYLNSFESEIKPIIKARLQKAAFYEELLQKDMYAMSSAEALDMFTTFNLSSLQSLRGYVRDCRKYVDWCVDQGLTETNNLRQIKQKQLEQCVSPFKKASRFIPYETVTGLIQNLINPMDKAIVWGLYFGLNGEGSKELVLLREQHLHPDRETVSIPEPLSKPERMEIYMPKEIQELFLEAMNTYTYIDFKGRTLPLEGDGIVKVFTMKKEGKIETSDLNKARMRIVERLRKFNNIYGISNLSITTLTASGMIKMIRDLAQKANMTANDFINTEGFQQVRTQYNIQMITPQFRINYKDYL